MVPCTRPKRRRIDKSGFQKIANISHSMYAERVTSRVPVFFRYGDELVLDKPEVNNNSDKMAICGRKMLILESYCNVLIHNVKF